MAEEKQNFEDSLRKLEQLVSEMESGQLPLDEMMRRFEEGQKLAASCTRELAALRRRIEKVVSAPNDPPQIEPLEIL